MASTPSTSTAVPIISVRRLEIEFRIAGAVQKTPSFSAWLSVTRQCGKYASHTTAAPRIAPSICAVMYSGTFAHANFPIEARAIVTAGLMCAPLNVPIA